MSWRLFLVGGVVVGAVHVTVPPGMPRDVLFAMVALGSLAALVLGIRRHSGGPWWLFAAGVACWVAGDLLWGGLTHLQGRDLLVSAADLAYLVGYPLLALAVYRMARRRGGVGDRNVMLDVAVAAAVAAYLVWAFLMEPLWFAAASPWERAVVLAYPIGDVLILTQLVHLHRSGRVRPSILLLLAGGVLSLLGDLAFQAGRAGWLEVTPLVESCFLLSYVLWAAAAWHPAMAQVLEPKPRAPGLSTGHLVFVGLMMLVIPVTLGWEVLTGARPHVGGAVAASVVVVVANHLRIGGMARAMRAQADRLARLARTDPLTHLANRREFLSVLDARLGADGAARPPRDGPPEPVAVLLVGLDRLTEMNDTLGHRVGDELLCAVAARLADPAALVARISDQSFGIVLTGDPTVAAERAATVRDQLLAPFELSEVTVSLDVAVGIAIGPADGGTAEELRYRADLALSVARGNPDGVARYSDGLAGAPVPLHLMTEFRAALAAGDIVVHYQPLVDLAAGRVTGVEALVRWQHPQHGLLAPATFVPAAERSGLIRLLTVYVLDRAVRQVAQWRRSGRELHLAVNLSVHNLLDRTFVADVRHTLERYRMPAAGVELEITETSAMVDPNRALLVLGALEELGVALAVDDYGTGYSSLAYLKRLPVGRLKIDRAFVSGLLRDEASAAIVRSTVEMAHNLGLRVTAEGVEDDDTLVSLRAMGCDDAQGFGLARPVPAAQVPQAISTIESRLPTLFRVSALPSL